jgi:hypothetical protein
LSRALAREFFQDRRVATENPLAEQLAENAFLRNYTLRAFLNATIISRHRTARMRNATRRGARCFGC